jgi:hypothetical protein
VIDLTNKRYFSVDHTPESIWVDLSNFDLKPRAPSRNPDNMSCRAKSLTIPESRKGTILTDFSEYLKCPLNAPIF